MASKSRHRWPSRRHRGIFSWRRIQGAGGFGRTTNMAKGCRADRNVTVRNSEVSFSFPALLEVLLGNRRTICLGADAHMNE